MDRRLSLEGVRLDGRSSLEGVKLNGRLSLERMRLELEETDWCMMAGA